MLIGELTGASLAAPKWLRLREEIDAFHALVDAARRSKAPPSGASASDEPLDHHRAIGALFARWAEGETISSQIAANAWQAAMQVGDVRKPSGAFYTSLADARDVARALVASIDALPSSILEPTCGGGTLLVALLEALETKFQQPATAIAARVTACDLDPIGLHIARWRVRERFGSAASDAIDWRVTDALSLADGDERWALFFANPPFGNAIEKATSRSTKERTGLKKRFPLAARGAFDRSSVFVELAHQLTHADGAIGLILPTSFLAQPSALTLRKTLAQTRALRALIPLASDAFIGASVSTSALIFSGAPAEFHARTRQSHAHVTLARGRTLTPDTLPLRTLTSGLWGKLMQAPNTAFGPFERVQVTLGEAFACVAGSTTDEAYRWKPFLRDRTPDTIDPERSPLPPHDAIRPERPFLIAGMIEPFALLWGTQPTRYLGENYAFPHIDTSEISEQRQQLAGRPRVLVAGLSRAIEAWPDSLGSVVGAVSTLSLWPQDPTFPIPVLAAILNSALVRTHYANTYGALALSGGNIQVTRQKLLGISIPSSWARFPTGTPARAHAMLTQILNEHAVPLNKLLPTADQIDALIAGAGVLARQARLVAGGRLDTSAPLWEALLDALERDALSSLTTGALDMLLLAIAKNSPEPASEGPHGT